MSKERLREALISIGIGVTISFLSLAVEMLRHIDAGLLVQWSSSSAGMLAYHVLRIKNNS